MSSFFCEQVWVLPLNDVVQEVDVHVGVFVPVHEWRLKHVQFLSGGDTLGVAGGAVECARGRRLTRRGEAADVTLRHAL